MGAAGGLVPHADIPGDSGSLYDRLWREAFFSHWRGLVTGLVDDGEGARVYSLGPRLSYSVDLFQSSLSTVLDAEGIVHHSFDFKSE
eukprot:1607771-Pyramimonas_sp.AAC.1